MSDLKPKIQTTKRLHFNSIWLVPLVAVVVAGWMLYQNWASQGPTIEIVAPNAEGITAGKTKVKARNVDVGVVTAIHLSDDYNHAVISVLMNGGTSQMLRDDTKFWVIKPRIGREGISGLGTLLSGAFIEMEPGHGEHSQDHFKMLPQPPLTTSDDKGIRLRLSSSGLSKMDVGSPIHFHGFEVGYIEKVGFDIHTGDITYRVFIRAPYDALVNSAVQFWLTPGLTVESSARGVQVKMDSLETLISGGISFGVTKGSAGKPVPDFTHFHLYASRDQAENHRYDKFIRYIFLFNSNVSGLEKGAPVEFRGIRIGTVTQVPYHGSTIGKLDALKHPAIPVLARIEPQRINADFNQGDMSLASWKALFAKHIKHGLRASLETSNLFTGAKVIDLDFVAHPNKVKIQQFAGFPSFPTVPDKFQQMENKLVTVLNHLANAPVGATFVQLQQTLEQAKTTFASMNQTSAQLKKLIKSANSQQLPANLKQTLMQINKTLADYQRQGVMGQSVANNLQSLQQTLDELQPLIRKLRAQPNSLIFDHPAPVDKQPPAGVKTGASQ
ncbi:intermembrane transport protein PqiB [Celerinatantimonas diazotrophica]|uniref:Paraquat-inducible protein B n=1 Tax=Celerinatantimonas diazotrophica TaxID=412034 RepID=A0A4R1K7J6_9GAMM|nr:intermembrane transport protein PqiB [Celerinatantimonas diazotrophica]TCK59039.1 paraquat-inducible protein B [Celerinatantimonas diazotrophica]CAG9297674.1 Intermembrane transport protein PqiB [Celerinatantimonas diazotrophica]